MEFGDSGSLVGRGLGNQMIGSNLKSALQPLLSLRSLKTTVIL